MNEAPARIWVDACEAVNNAPSWIDELRVAHKDSYVNDDLSGQQYIRADIYDEHVKELLSTLRKWQELGERTLNEHILGLDANTAADFCQGIRETKEVLKRFGDN